MTDPLAILTGLNASWLWLIAGLLLSIAEIVAPGFYLMWVGFAALLTAAAAAFGLGFAGQFVLFAVLSVLTVYIGRRYFQTNAIKSEDPLLNDRGARLVGSVVTAVEPVDATGGRVKVGDSIWSARGTPAQAGERLRVTACDGSVLIVERA